MAQPLLNATELDFDQIKANLKDYFLRQDSPINDWNYDGSGLNMMLDVLAYNTHYNAVLAHLNLNESFIDTAQLRSSVISQAKLLGYVPNSIGAASATVTVAFTPTSTTGLLNGASLYIPKGTKFTGTTPDGSFTYITHDAATATYVSSTSTYNISGLSLVQGVQRSQTYQVDNSIPNQKFVIDDSSADINSTLEVLVYDSQNAGSPNKFTQATGGELSSIAGPTSTIYFLSMNSRGKYEVTFGDGVFGVALKNLNVVQLNYISTQGTAATGVNNFQFADTLTGISSAIATLTNSLNGTDEESIDSIRFNAPASLIAQNRAVTANDYIALLRNPDIYQSTINAINVWGGEDEVAFDPINAAQYAGKVYICIDPAPSDNNLVYNAIKPYRVMSVTPVMYPVDYINLYLNVNFKYSPNLTSNTANQLINTVNGIISNYSSASLQSFTGVFRSSNLLRQIDLSDPSILNSDIQVSFYKNYTVNQLDSSTAVTNTTTGIGAIPNGFVTSFGNALFGTMTQVTSMVSSDAITISSMTTIMPSNTAAIVSASTSASTTSVMITSSPGIGGSGLNTLTFPYLVYGATVTGSGIPGSTTIAGINNTGAQTIITLSANATTTVSSNTLTITPPTGTYYLKDGPDPSTTSSRRLFLSKNSSSVAVLDPKYTSTGSDIHIGTVFPSTGKIELYRYISGTATSGSTTTLTDTAKAGLGANWLTNQFVNCVLYITAGSSVGSTATISSNSTDTLYFSAISAVDSTTQYVIIRSAIDITTTAIKKIYSRPASNDVAPSRHQLVQIDMNLTTPNISATADAFAQAGVSGANGYTTFSRDPQS